MKAHPLVIVGGVVALLYVVNRKGIGAWSRGSLPMGTRDGTAAAPGPDTNAMASVDIYSMENYLLGSASPAAMRDVPYDAGTWTINAAPPFLS